MPVNPRFTNIKTKIDADPAIAGKTAQEVLDYLDTLVDDIAGRISGADFYNVVDKAEKSSLTPLNKAEHDVLCSLEHVNTNTGENTRDSVDAVFPAGGATQSALTEKLTRQIPRSQKEGYGKISYHDIEIALGI